MDMTQKLDLTQASNGVQPRLLDSSANASAPVYGQSTGLTSEDIRQLRSPFPKGDHEELQGFWYIKEDSIMGRIEDVDPCASIDIIKSETITQNDVLIRSVVTMAITIKGVTRTGIGSSYFAMQGKKPNEPEKSAATDALKRTARLFGIGRYLLSAPSGNAFDKYLASLGAPVAPVDNQQTNGNGASNGQSWADAETVANMVKQAIDLLGYANQNAVANALDCDLSDLEEINDRYSKVVAWRTLEAKVNGRAVKS
jgi:hypothetical protein